MFATIKAWIPDADNTTPGVLPDVRNMIPTLRGYAAAPTPLALRLPALAAACRGGMVFRALDDTGIVIAGTQTKLYAAGTSSWSDKTRTADDYTGSSASRWCFTIQGNVIIATNGVDEPQFYDIGTSTLFADVSGMPKALLAETVGNFVLIANYNDGTETLDGWGCSAIGDYTDWTASIDTQCTYGRLYDTPGPLLGLKRLGEYAVFYKRRSMYLARYVGTPRVWDFSMVSDEIGAVSQDCIARVGQAHYFVGEDNFYVYDTASVRPIGEPIREWFNAACNNAKRSLITSVHNKQAGTVFWYYPSGNSETLTDWVAYNYRTDKWGKGELAIEAALEYVTAANSYDDLETPYPTYDAYASVTYDDLSRSGNTQLPAIFTDAHVLSTLTGIAAGSGLNSSDIGEDGSMTLLSRVRPRYLVAPTEARMTNYYRDAMGDSMTNDTTTTQVSGRFDALRSARWHRLRLEFEGDVEITGADITLQADGEE